MVYIKDDEEGCRNCIHFEETIDYYCGHKYSDGLYCNLMDEWIDWFDMLLYYGLCDFFEGDE